jgi:formate dehydrogenase subunit delta
MSPDEKLIYMANQIADFFRAQGHDRAVTGIADHIQRFWDPHMRRRFLAIAPAHADVDPLVAEAFKRVKVPSER